MFLWIVIVGGISSFIASMGIGANDAANAFASSVGSKALTMRQAAIIASIFETSGAILLGSHVTDTIRKGIADYQCFENDPEIFMYGCMYVIISVSIWLFLASYLEMPVSTTHSCVGGMIGMTIASVGSECVIWYKKTDTFPFVGGVGGIVLSWFISPICSGIISSIIFGFTRKFVLLKNYESNRINYIYPILVGSTITINCFFIIYKGAKGIGLDDIKVESAFAISFGSGFISGIITIPLVPKVRKIVNKKFINYTSYFSQNDEMHIQNNVKELNISSINDLITVSNLHDKADKFDLRIEEIFKYLQIFTAACDAFSHGANDVANAVGPFAAIYLIYRENDVISKKIDMDDDAYWILGIGGIGISFGLILYGKKIIHAIGNKLCKITPSRGVSIELGSALIIIAGSRLKIPLSTTHCQVGATIGVGLLENKSCFNKIEGVNSKILSKVVFGWIITCIIVGITSALLTAQGIYSPILKNQIACNNNSSIIYI
uniref:Phosphate transporter n=1 Tax=viral metagenome TaxID=1070528 RepID=A0A6C0AZ07_9ZZZZ|tara:strand:- start:36060 stop:37535 length:1476 start_codon:yes stop_codon:yes gene_type:complete